MRTERIDIGWATLPRAFVWKTPYADQHGTDTLLLPMEGDGHYAWGKSCPPYITMARVGGLSASGDIQALCAEHEIPCWVGGMLESAIDGAICAELATLPNFAYPGDIFPSSYFYRKDIGTPEIVLSGPGEVATSRVPGIAQEPDAGLLKEWTAEHASLRI
jgi:hypothetical protein